MDDRIETERLQLRPFQPADSEKVVEILGDFSVSKWLAKIPHPFCHADLRLLDPRGETRWPGLMAITLEDHVIGGVSTGQHCGYYLAPDQWGQGFATEAAAAALDYHFANTASDRMPSGYFTGNEASGNVLRKLGFVETGRSYVYCAARDCEVANIDMELARETWEAQK